MTSGRLDSIPAGTLSNFCSGISQREAKVKTGPVTPWCLHRSPSAVESLSPVAADARGSPTGEERR